MAHIGKWTCIFCSLFLWAQETRADLWDEALVFANQKQYSQAISSLEKWIQEYHPKHSPEAYFNLGHLYVEEGLLPQAAYSYLQVLQWSSSPLLNWNALQNLQQVQKQLGWNDGFWNGISFIVASLLGPNWLIVFFVLSFWGIFSWAWLRWGKGKKNTLTQSLCFVSTFFFLAGVGLTLNYGIWNSAVVSSSSPKVVAYQKPESSEGLKAFELPLGSLVQILSEKENFYEISLPAHGWISKSSVLRPSRPVSNPFLNPA